jgi:hypothetical protein
VNGVDGIYQHITRKVIILIMFQNFKIGTLTKKNLVIIANNDIESKLTPIETIIKVIKFDKT